ncbi:MAG: hypothetical protein ABIQ47_02000 [Tepidiformaceae bacterium]
MRTENGLTLDLDAVRQLLETGEVVTIGFTLMTERLLVDTRSNDRQAQFAEMVEPVSSVQERHIWLGRHRGTFGVPRGFAFFVWPHTVRGLVEREVLAPLRARLHPDTLAKLDAALAEAAEAERQALQAIIRGDENWPTLWSAGAH